MQQRSASEWQMGLAGGCWGRGEGVCGKNVFVSASMKVVATGQARTPPSRHDLGTAFGGETVNNRWTAATESHRIAKTRSRPPTRRDALPWLPAAIHSLPADVTCVAIAWPSSPSNLTVWLHPLPSLRYLVQTGTADLAAPVLDPSPGIRRCASLPGDRTSCRQPDRDIS